MTPINAFLLQHNLRIAQNPCVSPDFCLDWKVLAGQLKASGAGTKKWVKSGFETKAGAWQLIEDVTTGDCAWLLEPRAGVKGAAVLADGVALAGKTRSLARAPSASARASPRCTGRPSSGR
jgi:hypothetical protein